MVFVLHRYILRELTKVFILTTIALTLIMSLGSVLAPIQEYGIGPSQVVYMLIYFIPVTLTFVLPLAALFAAALVYGRFADDNELDACRASGISLWTMVYPGLTLAIAVAIANLILSFYVVPTFVHSAEAELKADAKQILFRNIQRKGFYELPNRKYRIYADQADTQNGTLAGVIVTEAQRGRIERIISTDTAKVTFSTHQQVNEVRIAARNLYQIGGEDQGWFFVEKFPFVTEFPSLLKDNVKFKKVQELKDIRSNPLRFYPVEQIARRISVQYASELLAEDINKALTEGRGYYEVRGEPYSIHFSAGLVGANTDQNSDQAQVDLSTDVTIAEIDSETGLQVQSWYCTRAMLKVEGDEFEPTLKLEMYSPRWQKQDGTEGIAAGRKFIRGLIPPMNLLSQTNADNALLTLSPQAVADKLRTGPSDKLITLQAALKNKINRIIIEIDAEMHSRLVTGLSCVPVIIIGVGLGVYFKGGHPLTALGVSCVPAMLIIVCIITGKDLARNSSLALGAAVMWGGLLVFSICTIGLYRKLLRN